MAVTFWKNEFAVNSTTASDQFTADQAVAVLGSGRFAVAYTSFDGTANTRMRAFEADGTPVAADFVVNDGGNFSTPPAVAVQAGSSVLAMFAGSTLSGRFVDQGAAPSGASHFDVSATAFPSEPSVAFLSDDTAVTVWRSSDTGDGDADCIRMRLLNPSGLPIGTETIVNTTAAGIQALPRVATLSNDAIIVVWQSADTGDGSQSCVRARLFDSGGDPVANDFILNTTTSQEQLAPTIARLADGRLLAAWASFDPGAGDMAIRARFLDLNGAPQGADFVVNQAAFGSRFNPVIVGLADNRFLVLWESSEDLTPPNNGSFDIRGRLFNADGTPDGGDFFVNTTRAGSQAHPSAALMADGRVVVTWTDGDLGSYEVRSQIIDPRGAPIVGDAADNTIYANDADEQVDGRQGADTIFGMAGADTLTGAAGNDTLTGGTGNDTFRFFVGDGKSDIHLRNDNGNVGLWQMDGLTIASAATVSALGADWQIMT